MTTNIKETLQRNLTNIKNEIAATCNEINKDVNSVRLLPITKTVPPDILRAAFELGLANFGENKIQEAKEKHEALDDLKIKWSMVGHLQSNKAKYVAKFIDEFHALDSLSLAQKLNKKLTRKLDVYIQVNTSGEANKYGLPPDQVRDFTKQLAAFENLVPRGFMTLAIFSNNEKDVNACFETLRQIRDETVQEFPDICELSMGMSGDFRLALRQDTNIIRIGQALFGTRQTPDTHYWPK